jgi:hypothetical protein
MMQHVGYLNSVSSLMITTVINLMLSNKLVVLSLLKLTTLNVDMPLRQIILYMAEVKILIMLIIQRVDQQEEKEE